MDESVKVLVGCPVFEGHRKWIKQFANQYSEYDVMFIDNTIDEYDKGLVEYIKSLASKPGSNIVNVEKHKWNPRNEWVLYMLGDCYQRLIDYALDNGYTHFLWTACDIFLNEGSSVDKLLSYEKDYVGYPVNMYAMNGPPSVYKDNWLPWDEHSGKFKLNYYSWDEIDDNPYLTKVYGCIGLSLISRKIMEKCRFEHPDPLKDIGFGEDLLLIDEINRNGFELYCDFGGRATNYTEPDKYVFRMREIFHLHNSIKRDEIGREEGEEKDKP